MAVVLDTSVALSWLFADELTDRSVALLNHIADVGAVVPAHWPCEVANGAWAGQRRQKVDGGLIARWGAELADLSIAVEPSHAATGIDLLPLARAHQLTVYDAAYLALAEKNGLPLATFDNALIRAARSVGVSLAGENA